MRLIGLIVIVLFIGWLLFGNGLAVLAGGGDQCPDIEGTQWVVPTGYVKQDGRCLRASSDQFRATDSQAPPSGGSPANNGSGNAGIPQPSGGGIVLNKPNQGFSQPYQVRESQPDGVQAVRTETCANVWRGTQCDLTGLRSLSENEWYVAHGDVFPGGKGPNGETANCGVLVWTQGKPGVNDINRATWKMVMVAGPSNDARNDEVAAIQKIACDSGVGPVKYVR